MKRFKLWQKTLLFGCLCGAPLAAALFWELAYVRAPARWVRLRGRLPPSRFKSA